MKKLLVIVALCLPALLAAQMTYVPDDNFEQALIDLGYDTAPLNDSVPTKNIQDIDQLIIAKKGIKDLTGIEDFDSLSYLMCFSNQLIALDFSKNKLLTNIYCYDNQLRSLNLKNGNTIAMKKMHAYKNPELYCIQVDEDILDTTNIYRQWYYDYQVEFFEDCSQVPYPQKTYVPDDWFEEILIRMGIDAPPHDDSVLTRLAAVQKNLEIRFCDLEDLTGIEDFTALEGLYLRRLKIKTLDLRSNTELITLFCDQNMLTDIDISNCPNLYTLWCFNNQLTSLDVSNNSNLLFIECRDNQDLDCIQVADSAKAANISGWNKDSHTIYSEDCGYVINVEEEINPGNNIILSPNPAKDFIEIKIPPLERGLGGVSVYDVLGSEVLKVTTPSLRDTPPYQGGESVNIDVSSLSPGVYFVSVGGRMYKFVKI